VRLQKDQINLVRAMTHVVRELPQAHVLMVGEEVGDYAQQVRHEIMTRGLQDNVSILGQRMDVQAILAACDVGVLSSESEGLPLSLIEYGMAGLPSVATRVGQCPDVLGDGAAGLLVPPKEPEALARGLLHLLSSPERRNQMGKIFRRHAELHYGQRTGIRKVCEVYDALSSGR
jgi:glycosyltransferase involved in cell wall biosynthesis